ncbi:MULTISPECIES: MliC family protein [unclassified Pseudomonas]|uniref:MliC family protein n=1 Tax=unclassified Pseudomonas TaxID=196821 RepID=UPI001F5B836E|nr:MULTISPECIES: MliC family protein [unclassified Pseudomonas]
MLSQRFRFAALLVFLASPLLSHAATDDLDQADDSQEQGAQSTVARYQCEGGMRIEAAYLNLPNGDSFATLQYKGHLIPMHISQSGSGALYVADDEQNSYRWHTKGDRGMLSFMAADHTAEEESILKDCKELPGLE